MPTSAGVSSLDSLLDSTNPPCTIPLTAGALITNEEPNNSQTHFSTSAPLLGMPPDMVKGMAMALQAPEMLHIQTPPHTLNGSFVP